MHFSCFLGNFATYFDSRIVFMLATGVRCDKMLETKEMRPESCGGRKKLSVLQIIVYR